ncbi:hypothetical protein GF337_20305, partial [candidate division KSB1 bacterium]|nr:hypothetical protein [candidate division KSB1 bacterium]
MCKNTKGGNMNHIFKFKFLVIVLTGLLMAGLCLAQGQPKKLAITKGPHVSYISETAVEIQWETNKEASGFVEYGTDSSMTDTVSVDEVSEEHEVELIDLQPDMEYLYRVVAIDTSGTDTFRTRILKFTTGNDENESPHIEIIDGKKDIAVGDTVRFMAIYKNNGGVEFDTTFVWSVKPDSLGKIDSTGLFVAMTPGKGIIYAQLGDLVDSTEIEIKEDDSGKDDDEKGKNDRFVVIPGDTTVEVGSVIQFNAYYKNDQDVLVDTVAQWSLSGSPIGTISENGELNVIAPGIGFVKAKLDNWEEVVLVTAVNTDVDSSSLNTIKISRVFPDGKVLPPHIIHEGEIYNIGGLQPPFHLLNGGKVYFPYGCLDEDIVIHIKLPEFANVENDTVKFGRKM